MQNPYIRFMWRVFFIIATCYGLFSVWAMQSERSSLSYQNYSAVLGEKVSTIAAGSLSPWLHNQLIQRESLSASAKGELNVILKEFLTLGDIIGIRLFNRYGETLGSVGEVNNLLTDLAVVDAPVQIHVSPVMYEGQEIGFIRFVITNQRLTAEQADAFQRQQSLVLVTVLLGAVLGGLSMRWYYLSVRREAANKAL